MPTIYQTLSEFQRDYQYDLSDSSMHLGEGNYGQVVRAFDHQNNKWVALKIGKDLMQEYEAARSLNHRNIANYEDCYCINDKNIGQRDYAIMQLYTAGNLANLLQTTTLADVQKKELVRGILEGLQYLHAQKRIHRDFKPANILIAQLPNGNYRPLIADFGLTKIVGQNDYIEGSDVQLSDSRGTASYKAPEQIAGETAHYNLDLWAFGVILYEIATGERPFKRGSTGTEKQRDNELYLQIQNVVLPPQLNSIAEPYQAMIRRCLIKDIHQRVRKEDELLGLLEGNKEPVTKTEDLVSIHKLFWGVDDWHIRWSFDDSRFYSENQERFHVKGNKWIGLVNDEGDTLINEFVISNIIKTTDAICFDKTSLDGERRIRCTIFFDIFKSWGGGIYTLKGLEEHPNGKKAQVFYTCMDREGDLRDCDNDIEKLKEYFLILSENFRLTAQNRLVLIENEPQTDDTKSISVVAPQTVAHYEGEKLNGKYHGKGKYTWPSGTIYEGDFVYGNLHGKGRKIYSDDYMNDGDMYEFDDIDWLENTWMGRGIYEGDFVNGKRTGKGKLTEINGTIYEGDWIDGKRTGKGKLTEINGTIYEGDWIENKQTGKGKLTYANGNIEEGSFVDGKYQQKGFLKKLFGS